MTHQELKETGQKLLKSGQYAEAIPLLKSAAETLPKDETLWQELVMAARDNGKHEQAVEFAKLGIRHHARSDWLWRTLGGELVAIDRLDEAEKALSNSQNLNPNSDWLWRHTANLHRKRKNAEAEAKALEKLAALPLPDTVAMRDTIICSTWQMITESTSATIGQYPSNTRPGKRNSSLR